MGHLSKVPPILWRCLVAFQQINVLFWSRIITALGLLTVKKGSGGEKPGYPISSCGWCALQPLLNRARTLVVITMQSDELSYRSQTCRRSGIDYGLWVWICTVLLLLLICTGCKTKTVKWGGKKMVFYWSMYLIPILSSWSCDLWQFLVEMKNEKHSHKREALTL